MKIENETFTQIMKRFEPRYELRTVFSDFLTLSLCASSRNPVNGLSHYEDLYLQTISPYQKDELRHEFPKAYAQLVSEMDLRLHDGVFYNDILGEFYEQNLYRTGAQQYFTPWPICQFMAGATKKHSSQQVDKKLRILDPSCGSGRMLLAAKEAQGHQHEFYGIDIDDICVKMTALNMFFNSMWYSEVMCANALLPDDFKYSYKISLLPFGIFRIDQKEKSLLWNIMKYTTAENNKEFNMSTIVLGKDHEKFNATKVAQIKLF